MARQPVLRIIKRGSGSDRSRSPAGNVDVAEAADAGKVAKSILSELEFEIVNIIPDRTSDVSHSASLDHGARQGAGAHGVVVGAVDLRYVLLGAVHGGDRDGCRSACQRIERLHRRIGVVERIGPDTNSDSR